MNGEENAIRLAMNEETFNSDQTTYYSITIHVERVGKLMGRERFYPS